MLLLYQRDLMDGINDCRLISLLKSIPPSSKKLGLNHHF